MQPRRERVIPARRVRIAEKWSAFKKCLPTFLGGAFGVGGHAAAWAIFVPAIRSAGLQLFAAERIARLSFKPADFIEENGECRPMRRERAFVSFGSTCLGPLWKTHGHGCPKNRDTKFIESDEYLCHTKSMTKQEREEVARNRGRPALPEDQRTLAKTIRLTPSRWEKLRRLGTAWLGAAIDKAKEPTPKE